MTHEKDDPLAALLPKLMRRAERLTRSRSDAEDLCQETVLRMWRLLRGPEVIEEPERYAMTMLQNLARERWRRRRETEELSEEMLQEGPLAPARIACAELQAAIERLPVDQATLMRLVMAGETSPQVLADQVGVPKGTVMSRLARARVTLRGVMGLEGSVIELL